MPSWHHWAEATTTGQDCPEALPSVKEGPKTSAIIPLLTPTNFNNGKAKNNNDFYNSLGPMGQK